MHGSNSEYLADLENTFCAAPTKTAAISGVRPYFASTGEKASPPRTSAKKATLVARRTVGVMIAAPPLFLFLIDAKKVEKRDKKRERERERERASESRGGHAGKRERKHEKKKRARTKKKKSHQPKRRKMKRDAIIIMKVTAPVEDEKSPMNAE